jgi:hypothetical protein
MRLAYASFVSLPNRCFGQKQRATPPKTTRSRAVCWATLSTSDYESLVSAIDTRTCASNLSPRSRRAAFDARRSFQQSSTDLHASKTGFEHHTYRKDLNISTSSTITCRRKESLHVDLYRQASVQAIPVTRPHGLDTCPQTVTICTRVAQSLTNISACVLILSSNYMILVAF